MRSGLRVMIMSFASAATRSILFTALFECPAIFRQPVQSANDTILHRAFWLPAKRVDTHRVEQDYRIVANPATFATGIGEVGVDAEPLANPADRLIDRAGILQPE